MRVVEELQAMGHRNILATHPLTFEITTHHQLTKRGDCVIAVKATKSLLDLSLDFKRLCRNEKTMISVELEACGAKEFIIGRGSQALTLEHPTEMVGRKSTYVSDRTLLIHASKAASDIKRELIRELRSPETRVQIRLIAELK